MNNAKCPKCEEVLDGIHYESHVPNPISGYRGSGSFTAVAHPCGHAISAVPVTWEMRLEEIDKVSRELNQKLDTIHKEIANLSSLVRNISLKTKI